MQKNIFQFTLLILFAAACSHKPADVSNETQKQLAAEQESQYVTEVIFKKGSAQLTTSARQKIQRLLSSVQDKRKIDNVKVISWADEGYPSKEENSLSKAQQDLAKERNEEIRSYLKTQGKTIPVEMHSMASRPSTVSVIWGGSDARIKKSLESNGLTKVGTNEKSSYAIIMVMVK
jgi:hypothetical protein